MNKKQAKFIKIFLCFFLAIVFLPMLQFVFSPFKLSELQGAYLLKVMPKLNYNSWINQNYQDCTTIYLKHQTPFRAELIKARNQIDYTFFNKINSILTLSKDNYIFDPFYIKALYGEDLLPKEKLDNKFNSIKKTKKVLDSLNVPILVCFAPNKANYYSEKINLDKPKTNETNHHIFLDFLNQNNVRTIDFDSIFVNLKPKGNHLLIPKYGAHWSTYGAYISSTILLDRISEVSNIESSKIILDSIDLTSKVKFTDDDYLPSLNLMEKLESPIMVYPNISYKTKNKLNVLVIADSFFWNFYDLNLPKSCFSDSSKFWYYNKTIYDINRNEIGKRKESVSLKDLKNRDLVLILSADPSLLIFGFDFFEQTEKIYEIN